MSNAASETATGPRVFGAAIQGRRSEQQDSFRSLWLPDEEAWLLVVADGMGGHAGGALASRIAADTFVATFVAKRGENETLERSLQQALLTANSAIAHGQEETPEAYDMGTTLTAAYLSADGLAWISVGDSPLWLFRHGKIERINEDHSFRAEAANGAKVSANMLQSVLNGEPIALVDCRANPLPMRVGDFVVLASDGLLTLDEKEIARAVRDSGGNGAAAVTRTLLKSVEDRDKSNQDNCTVVVAAPYGTGGEVVAGSGWPFYRRVALFAVVLAILAAGVGIYFWRLS